MWQKLNWLEKNYQVWRLDSVISHIGRRSGIMRPIAGRQDKRTR